MSTQLFVANIDYAVTAEELKEKFSKFGEIRSVSLIIDKTIGRSKGYAFVDCETNAIAKKCKEKLRDTEFYGRKIIIQWAK